MGFYNGNTMAATEQTTMEGKAGHKEVVTQFLRGYAPANADLTWVPHDRAKRIGINGPSPQGYEALSRLAEGQELILLPVISWPANPSHDMKLVRRQHMKAEMVPKAQAIAHGINKIHPNTAGVCTDVVKVNYTNRSRPRGNGIDGKTSFFAGPIQIGKRYVIVDDRLDSGSTVRDLWRYVESQGGILAGVVETSANLQPMPLCLFSSEETKQRLFAVLWAASQPHKRTIGEAIAEYGILTEPIRQDIEAQIAIAAEKYLKPIGLRFHQLTTKEMNNIAEVFLHFDGMKSHIIHHSGASMDELWQIIAQEWKPKEIPALSTLANPEGLLNIRHAVQQQLMQIKH